MVLAELCIRTAWSLSFLSGIMRGAHWLSLHVLRGMAYYFSAALLTERRMRFVGSDICSSVAAREAHAGVRLVDSECPVCAGCARWNESNGMLHIYDMWCLIYKCCLRQMYTLMKTRSGGYIMSDKG